MEKIIDLHIHSIFSDGALSPNEIIDEAKKNNVSCIAIADHDSTEAYNHDLFSYAQINNIKLISAVEISTRFQNIGIHVLGYNFDLKNKNLQKVLKKLRNARQNYLLNVTKVFNKLGFVINVEKLKTISSVTKAHIAEDIILNKANNELLIRIFNHIPNKGEFIETIMNEGCPAYIEKFSIFPIEASQKIHDAGGKVILAHPVSYKYEDSVKMEQILSLINQMKADGIESNYLYVDRDENLIDETDYWNNFAKENNLISTVGSDFHNFDSIRPQIGFVNTSFKLSKQEIEVILKLLINVN